MSENTTDSTEYPDYEPPEVSQEEILFDILFMAIFGFLGTAFGLGGFYVVKKNSILKGIIEHYAFVDLLNLTIINACHLFWALPCALWTVNEAVPFLDNVFGGLAFTAPSISFPPKLFLGINRFTALASEGRFFKAFEKTKILQYIIMIVYPLITAAVYAIPGCHAIFIPYGQNFFYVEEGVCGQDMIYYTQVLASYIVLPVNTVFDCSVFYMMHKRISAFRTVQSTESKLRREQTMKEFRLAAQMVTNLCTGIILTVSIAIAQNYLASTIATFLVYTALWQLCTLVTSMSYVILLRERKQKDLGVALTVSSSDNQQAAWATPRH